MPCNSRTGNGSGKGVFRTRWGSLIDEHAATLAVVPEAPVTPGFDVVVVATATGVITGGTRRYRRASGTSDLYLKMEVDFDTFSAKALEGSFVFRLN